MRSSINGEAEKLRERLRKPEILALPGCYDVLSAMILETAGFEAVFLSGYGVAASHLGNPDIGLTTLSETALCARQTTARLGVPLVVDIDNGYGNEDNVIRTISELEHAGAAAVVMEDQIMPKRCGHSASKAVVPLAHYLRKLEFALKARRTPLVMIARTDALEMDEAILRANAFVKAGADATIIDGLRSLDDMKRFANEVPGPKQINLIFGGKTPILPLDELEKLGFAIALYSTPALYVSAAQLLNSMTQLKDSRDLNSIAGQSMKFGQFQDFIETRYMTRSELSSHPDANLIPEEDKKKK